MRAFEQRKKSTSNNSSFFSPKIQKKLKTGTPGDQFEVEADTVADKVVNNNSSAGLVQSKSEEEVQQKPISETISSVQSKEMKEEETLQKKEEEDEKPIQKKEEEESVQMKEETEEPIQAKCATCEKEEKVQKKDKKEEEKSVQKKNESHQTEPKHNGLEAKLSSSKGRGTALDKKTKNEMESGFGSDFSKVKIHTDTNAVQMSQELGAQAFTNGNDVYFNKGKYNPNSKEGKHLLAHELTHTVQQTGMVQKSALENHPEDLQAQRPENPQFKGNPPLEKANDNEMLISTGHKGGYVSEIQNGLLEWRETSLPNYGADGDFGSETRKAVLDFQIDQGLNGQEGIVGPETMGTLDNVVLAKKGGGKKDKKKPPCIEKPSNTAPYSKNFQGVKTVPFRTNEGCFKVSISVNAKCITKDCESFDLNIDHDKATQKTIKMDPTTHTKSTSFTFDTLKPGKHEIVLIMPVECRPAFSLSGSEFQVKGTIKIFG